jgi:hypothetical protein
MRRVHLIVLVLLLGSLVTLASPATATPARDYDFGLQCGGETVWMAWTPGYGSWTLHVEDGSTFVAHRWIVHHELMDPPGEQDVWLNRGHGAPMEQCWTACPFTGTPVEIWGVRTPVRGR